jgi:hypothetical protein
MKWQAQRFFVLLRSTGKTWKHGNIHPSGQIARYSEWTGRRRVEHLVHFDSGRHIGEFETVEEAEAAAKELLDRGDWCDLKAVKEIGRPLIESIVESHGGAIA